MECSKAGQIGRRREAASVGCVDEFENLGLYFVLHRGQRDTLRCNIPDRKLITIIDVQLTD